jgi:hypothetical protein
MVSCRRAALSVLAIIGMLTSFAATCAAGSIAPEHEQMACCKAGHHKCGTPAKPADCCKTNGSHEQQLTVAKTQSLTHPVWSPLAWALPAFSADAFAHALARPVRVDTSPPLRLDRPAYIRFSVLLI